MLLEKLLPTIHSQSLTLRFGIVSPLLLMLRLLVGVRDVRTALQAAGVRALLPAGFLSNMSRPCSQDVFSAGRVGFDRNAAQGRAQ